MEKHPSKTSSYLEEVGEALQEAEEQISHEYHGDHLVTEREKFIRAEDIVEHRHLHDIPPELADAVRGMLRMKKPKPT